MFAADNPLSTCLSRSQVHPAYRSLAHEKQWFGVSHELGILLSSYYSQFINDVAHAAIIASMLVFFYFDRGIFFFKRPRGHDDAEGTWVGIPSASGYLPAAFGLVHQGHLGRWVGPMSLNL